MTRKFFAGLMAGLLVQVTLFAQVDYRQQYASAKTFYKEGKYNLAMEAFKKVIPYDQANPFPEYGSFYYSLSAYHQGYLSVAKDMLNQIKTLYPKWEKIDEVNLWLAKIHIDNGDTFQGLRMLKSIKNSGMQQDISKIEMAALQQVNDLETMRMVAEEYPQDAEVGKRLAKLLSHDITREEDRLMLEALINKFRLKRGDYIPEAPPTFYKDVYSVSVLFPFMVNTLDLSATPKRNQIILDLYEGMRMAADTLAKQGIKIDLRAYDLEKNVSKIKTLLETAELKNTDLIVGPLFFGTSEDENKIVQDFSFANRINLINPISNNIEAIADNPFGFLLQPSTETIGEKSAEFLSTYDNGKPVKNCLIFYGTTRKDSVMAASFLRKAGEKGLNVVAAEAITRDDSRRVIQILATPNEYDQWKKPSQFTLAKDSLASIFVASDDPLIYSKVISSLETRGDSILLLGSELWLEGNAVPFEKYQRLGVIFAAPNYTSDDNPYYITLVKNYLSTHGHAPSDFVELGYETMLFSGHLLGQYGVYFQDAINKDHILPGYLNEGFSYFRSRSNLVVPFVAFRNGELSKVDTYSEKK